MIAAIITEMELRRDYINETINTIYFGGGTPSLLNSQQLGYILSNAYEIYDINTPIEITLEANPDDINPDFLVALRTIGFNRMSIGIQTFDDETLKFLNRAHDSNMAKKCFEEVAAARFNNISADLIYGIPNRNDETLINDLNQLIKYNPNHISAYCLTIELQTVFGKWAEKGKLENIDEEFAAHQYEIVVSRLKEHGYDQYEISNFCLTDTHAIHNTSYWQQKPYIGIGPSAHSYNGKSRQYNINNNIKYIKSIKDGVVPATIESLDENDIINDYLLTALRTKWGVDLKKYELEKKLDNNYLQQLITMKKAFIKDKILYLTPQGRLLADKITEDLLIT